MKVANRLDSIKLGRAMAARGLDGRKLAELSGLDKSTISRARRGYALEAATIRRIVQTVQAAPELDGAAELLA